MEGDLFTVGLGLGFGSTLQLCLKHSREQLLNEPSDGTFLLGVPSSP